MTDAGTTKAAMLASSAFNGGLFAYYDGVNPFDQNDGAVTVEPGVVSLYGSNVTVPSMDILGKGRFAVSR